MRHGALVVAVLTVAGLVAAACSDSSSEEATRAGGEVPASSTSRPPGSATTATGTPCDPAVPQTCTLRDLADRRDILIGAAVRPGPLADDLRYAEVLAAEFNSVTPENALKWQSTEADHGTFTWDDADTITRFAAEHDQRVRGHTLVWPNTVSDQRYGTLPDHVAEAPDAETMQRHLDDHIEAVVTRYADVVDRWDVVNEPLQTAGAALDPNVLTETLGEGWIVRAFHQVRELDPDAALYVNEPLVERPGAKHEALMDLVVRLRDAGAPIDGVGLQGHFVSGQVDRAGLETVMQDWDELGLEVAITELDIPTVASDEERHAEQYAEVMGACLAIEACVEVTLWGLTDAHTWLDDSLGPNSDPLLFDGDYEPKPAHRAVAATLAESE